MRLDLKKLGSTDVNSSYTEQSMKQPGRIYK